MNDINITKPTDFSEFGKNSVNKDLTTNDINIGIVASGWKNINGFKNPTAAQFNFLMSQFSRFVLDSNKYGINSWDANTPYPSSAIVWKDNVIWQSLGNNNQGNDPILDINNINWIQFDLTGGGLINLGDLTDVDTGGVVDGDVPTFNDSNQTWETKPFNVGDLNTLTDVDTAGVIDGDTLIFNSTSSKYEAQPLVFDGSSDGLPLDSVVPMNKTDDVVTDAEGVWLKAGVLKTSTEFPQANPNNSGLHDFIEFTTTSNFNLKSVFFNNSLAYILDSVLNIVVEFNPAISGGDKRTGNTFNVINNAISGTFDGTFFYIITNDGDVYRYNNDWTGEMLIISGLNANSIAFNNVDSFFYTKKDSETNIIVFNDNTFTTQDRQINLRDSSDNSGDISVKDDIVYVNNDEYNAQTGDLLYTVEYTELDNIISIAPSSDNTELWVLNVDSQVAIYDIAVVRTVGITQALTDTTFGTNFPLYIKVEN